LRTREAAFAALFAKISAAYAWKNAPSRRLVLFDASPKDQRPGFYQYEGGSDQYKWTASPYPARMIECELYIYLDGSDTTTVGATTMNNVKDAIDAALAPDPVAGKCTLGGTCEWARIEGKVESVPGDIDGDGLIILPIKITLP
jgi:hypothetical protein